ncbi:Hypothetical predicted protein, partial [Marmota monax]
QERSGCRHAAASFERQVCKASSVCGRPVKDAWRAEKLSQNGQQLTDLKEVHHEDKRSTDPTVKPIRARVKK